MEEALQLARAKDTKERMAGVERLHEVLESSRKSHSPSEVTSLVDCCLDLLKDNNFRVSQGALQSLASAAVLSGEHFKLHFNVILPAVVERLGDAKQPVRDAARRFLLTLMEVCSPTIIVERAGSFAWTNRSWRVREEFARTAASAICIFASTELTLQRVILPPILQMLNDSNQSVREAALLCIEEMYTQLGPQFRDELQRHHLPTFMVKDINIRLEKIEPKLRSSDGLVGNIAPDAMKSTSLNRKKSSPKSKSSVREISLFGGELDVTDKPIEPVMVYSEKELIREVEKIASTLVPEKDWSIRTAAMQRIEALVCGGAADYPCFHALLKQLVEPLSTQLSDRRSSIIKQACHLLIFLSKELLGDFEACAEMFIPVLFKLVVITVLVIAESADNCIKTMLRNCKVSRVLPQIADCAKNDRSAVLRARCCEYALLMLEYWADAPEIHRSADLYEDLIKCCVADAMSEVRSTARGCYRMFTKTWPEHSRRLFLSFDSVIQRIINDEDGGMHRRHASPSIRDRGAQVSRTASQTPLSNLPGYGTSAIVTMDKSASLLSGTSLSSGLLPSEAKLLGKGNERSLENVLHSSRQKVTAIESLLSSLDISERQNLSNQCSNSLHLGVDPPSARDPPFPSAVTALNVNTDAFLTDSTASTIVKASLPYTTKRASDRLQGGSFEEHIDVRAASRFVNAHTDRQYVDLSYKEPSLRDSQNNSIPKPSLRDSQNNSIPNFQRPLLRKHVSGRVSTNIRSNFDNNQILVGETSSYINGPASLHDALTEGLSPSSDWCFRVAAFNYLKTSLQQDPKGTQEVMQNFEKVMKLFFQHIDDPHHKVVHAALLALAEIIPACRKPFESYLDRILPHVFSRLIDPKELVQQPSLTILEIVSKTYSTDSLLPAFIRSLDEQRSPKAKLAVIEFAISSFNRNAIDYEGPGNSGILKFWLTKLTPLAHDKNTKLKDAAITCIISIYSHFDSTSVLNFILSLSVEEQNFLRRALKQSTPRIEVDLMNFLQNKKERQRSKFFYDPSDIIGTSFDDGYIGALKKTHIFGRYSSGSIDSDGGRKWSSTQESTKIAGYIGQAASYETQEHLYQNFETDYKCQVSSSKIKDVKSNTSAMGESMGSSIRRSVSVDHSTDLDGYLPTLRLSINGLVSSDHPAVNGFELSNETSPEINLNYENFTAIGLNSSPDSGISIPQILHLICDGSESSSARRQALLQLTEASLANNHTSWARYFNQILMVVLEVLDDSDSSSREVALSLIVEMLNNQRDYMEGSVEIIIEKLLHVSKDTVAKVSKEAEQCLSTVLSEYDPFRSLSVIVPFLVSEDERTLVTCINCLTKLVGRLSQVELTAQLPSFLPALFDAFGNQSADVRKTVVFCLVDIYIMLGKAFLPYLEGLNSMQLRLVTLYANRISQARTGIAIDTSHG